MAGPVTLIPQGQAGGSFLPNYPVNFSSATATTFATPPNTPGLGDLNGLTRLILNGVGKPFTSGAALPLFNVARPANSYSSGVIFYTLQATDNTNAQSLVGMVTYTSVDVNGTGTFTIVEVAGNQSKTVTGASTLTVAWTYVTLPGSGQVRMTPTTSLAAAFDQIYYSVIPLAGAVTII